MRLDSYLEELEAPARTRLVSGIDLVAQKIRLRLAIHQGEVLRDVSIGFPWVDWISTKPPPLAAIRSRVRSQLGKIAEVSAVTNVQASVSSGTIHISADVSTPEGEVSIKASISDPGTRSMSFAANIWGRAGSVYA